MRNYNKYNSQYQRYRDAAAGILVDFILVFCANACATGMVKPLVSPNAAPMIKEFIEPTPPTAARASVLTYRPTSILSTNV